MTDKPAWTPIAAMSGRPPFSGNIDQPCVFYTPPPLGKAPATAHPQPKLPPHSHKTPPPAPPPPPHHPVVTSPTETEPPHPPTRPGKSFPTPQKPALSPPARHDIPPSRLTNTPRSVSANTTNV